jgi:hypothetical protein
VIVERHRHRYEVNNNLLPQIIEAGLKISGRSGDGALVEVVEAPDHPWFVACQFHPEFTSTPRDGHPLFSGFVKQPWLNTRRRREPDGAEDHPRRRHRDCQRQAHGAVRRHERAGKPRHGDAGLRST